MKKSLILTMFFGLLIFVGPAWSITIGPTDVGSVDNLLNSAKLDNSGDQTEVDWVNDVLGTSFETEDMTKYSLMSWMETDTEGVYAIDFASEEPTYFFIKTGNIGEFDHFLYQNLASLNWGVVDLAELGVDLEIGVISHIGELGGRETYEVPEPTTLLLLGVGLVGLAALRRKL